MENKKKKIIFYLILLSTFYFLFSVSSVNAASLYFSPSSGNYHEGENFTISIKVETDVAINAVEGVFSFPTRYLEVIRLNKSNSVVNLWVQEPSFSNVGSFGNVSFEGVILNPGFTGPAGKIIDVVFLVKNKGAVELEFLRTAILANDGFGTNVTSQSERAKFILLAAEIQPKEEKIPGEPSVQQPTIILKEIKQELPEEMKSIIAFWNSLPSWLKVGALVVGGMTVLISFLILLSFGLIILIYLWKYALSEREVVLKRLGLGLKFSWYILRRTIRKVLIWFKMGEKEFESDIKYSVGQLKTEFKEAASPHLPPLTKVIKDFWLSIGRIIKRFFTRNIPPSGLNKKDSRGKRT